MGMAWILRPFFRGRECTLWGYVGHRWWFGIGNQGRTGEATHVDCVREFVDEGHSEHERGAQLLGRRRRGEGMWVQDAQEAGGEVDQGVCAAKVEGEEGVVVGVDVGIGIVSVGV